MVASDVGDLVAAEPGDVLPTDAAFAAHDEPVLLHIHLQCLQPDEVAVASGLGDRESATRTQHATYLGEAVGFDWGSRQAPSR